MSFQRIRYLISLFLLLCSASLFGAMASSGANSEEGSQGGPAASAESAQGAVSYASVTELNGLLAQLEATSKTTQADLNKLRIDRWKTDNSNKKQALGTVDSILRNLQGALPEMI